MTDRPNVLFIVIDQFRADLLSDAGLGAVARMPNLRRLRNMSAPFERHYSVATPCGPSRVSLLTGQYISSHGATRNGTPLPHDTPNLARAARTMGYEPALFGYTDTAADPRGLAPDDPRLFSYEEVMPGFDEVLRMRLEDDAGPWRDYMAARGTPLPEYPDLYRPAGDGVRAPAIYDAESSDTAFLTDGFLKWVQVQDPGWFALVTYIRPHPPFVAPEPYNDMFDPAEMPPPATSDLAHPFLEVAHQASHPALTVVGFLDLEDTPQTVSDLRAVYLGLAAEVDTHVGRILDWLEESGTLDKTLVVLTADHGEMLGDHGLWGKGTFHEAAFHVPLIIRDPVRPQSHGVQLSGMTESIDVAPTILNAIGAEVPTTMEGSDLAPLLDDPGAPAREVTMSEYDFGNPLRAAGWQKVHGLTSREANLAVFRQGGKRLVSFACDYPQILFDMEDGGEARDLVDAPAARDDLLALNWRMLRHRMSRGRGRFAQTLITRDGPKTGKH